jgi:N-acyl homoserine lactone hydrolase
MSNTRTYSIRPLAYGQGPRDLSQWTYLMNMGIKVNSAHYLWYIEGSEPKTIVDTGARIYMFTEKGIIEEEIISVEDGLFKMGLHPEDIGIVILTHLHLDHVALANLYKNAKFIVQKKELEYARNPHILHAIFYESKYFENIDLEVIDGNKIIFPGIQVLLTPGHSPGGQSVEINTEKGKAIITGFCCTMETFIQTDAMKQKGMQVAAPGIHTDAIQAYESAVEVKKRADFIIPLHDAKFINVEHIP